LRRGAVVQDAVVILVGHVQSSTAIYRDIIGVGQAGGAHPIIVEDMAGKVGLAIDGIRGTVAHGIMQDAVVILVGHVQATIAIQRYPHGSRQIGGAHAPPTDGAGEVRLAINCVGRGAASREVQHPVVVTIRHIQAAAAVDRQSLGESQAGSGHAVVVLRAAAKVGLAVDDGRGRVSTLDVAVIGKVQHPAIGGVRHVEAACGIHRHALRICDGGVAHATGVGKVMGKVGLAVDGIGGGGGQAGAGVIGKVQYPCVGAVRHVEAAIAIHRQSGRLIQIRAAYAFSIVQKVGLAVDGIGGRAAG
jgi:hypothetical protein